jgi:glutathione S-transferase
VTHEVFGDARSGNCQKVKWALQMLGLPYRWVEVDVARGETRSAELLALNPAGQVPIMRWPDGEVLAQSNAIVWRLFDEADRLPRSAAARAETLQWMFWEQYSHEPYIAVRRYKIQYLGLRPDSLDPVLLERGDAALRRLEARLRESDWLVGRDFGVADLCLFPYTRLAPEGGFELGAFPAVLAWLDRCQRQLFEGGSN